MKRFALALLLSGLALAGPAPTTRAPALTVVLDPGHGGGDPGMVSRWVTEKEVTLDVAMRVRTMLRARGVNVLLTREHDVHLSANKTNDLEARSRMAKADRVNAYVSIHVNAASPTAQGIETYYFGQPLETRNRTLAVRENGGGSLGENLTRQATSTAQSLLGDLIGQAKIAFSKQLATRVQSRMIAATGAVNRGVQQEAFYVIRNPTTPAILIELGFGTHPTEGVKLAQSAYRERLADAIADGICEFLNVR